MADTQRTLSALLTSLFVDGQAAGAITPQDIRDLIVSFSPSYGGLWFSGWVQTPIATPGTMVKSLGTTTLTNARNVTMPINNRLVYTGVPDRHFHVSCSVSFTTLGAADDLSIAIAKDGVVVDHSKLTRFTSSATDRGSTALNADLTFSTNEYIEIFVTNEDATEDVAIQQGYLFMMGMLV